MLLTFSGTGAFLLQYSEVKLLEKINEMKYLKMINKYNKILIF